MKIDNFISAFFHALLIFCFVYLLAAGESLLAIAASVAILLSMVPGFVEREYGVDVPWFIEFLIFLALFLHIGGISFGWYSKIWFYDIVAHFLGTAVVSLIGFMIVYVLYLSGKIKVTIKMIGLFTFFFAVAVGGLWEIAEFASDFFLGTHAQLSLLDTDKDLIFDVIGALIASFFGMWYVKVTPERKLRAYLKKKVK